MITQIHAQVVIEVYENITHNRREFTILFDCVHLTEKIYSRQLDPI